MDDRSAIKAMLERAKIEYRETTEEAASCLYVERGYIGFCVEFKFKPDGALENVSAWE